MKGHSKERLRPIHPGEVLGTLLEEAGTTPNALALALRVPSNRIGAIVKGQRGITSDTALRLARYFGTSAQMWVNLQAKWRCSRGARKGSCARGMASMGRAGE